MLSRRQYVRVAEVLIEANQTGEWLEQFRRLLKRLDFETFKAVEATLSRLRRAFESLANPMIAERRKAYLESWVLERSTPLKILRGRLEEALQAHQRRLEVEDFGDR